MSKVYRAYLKTIAITGFCIFAQSCVLLSKNNKPRIRGIKVTQVFPSFNKDWNVTKYDTIPICLYFLHNEAVYDFPPFGKIYINDILDSTSLSHTYVAFSKGNTSGIEFTYRPEEHEEPVVLDTVFNHIPKIDLNSFFSDSNNNVVLRKKIKDSDSGLFTEEYFLNKKSDTSLSSILLLSYSDKAKITDYSFSEQFDSAKQMKLVEVKLNTFPKYYPALNKTQAGYTLVLKIEEIEPENKEKLMYYFKKAKARKGN